MRADFDSDGPTAAQVNLAAVAHDAVRPGAEPDAARALNIYLAQVLAFGEGSVVDAHGPGSADGQDSGGFVGKFAGCPRTAVGSGHAHRARPGHRQAAGVDAAAPGIHLEPGGAVPGQAENRVRFIDDQRI